MDVDGDSYRGWENPATRPNVYELLKEQIDMHRCTEGEGNSDHRSSVGGAIAVLNNCERNGGTFWTQMVSFEV